MLVIWNSYGHFEPLDEGYSRNTCDTGPLLAALVSNPALDVAHM
jgi:hypothetical protein